MLPVCRHVACALVFSCAIPSTVSAGELKVPTIAASAAAAADWATTYHTLKNYRTREMNPLLRPLDDRPATMVAAGAAMDIGILTAWNMTIGRKNEKLAAVGLWSMAAFRTYLAFHNLRNQSRAARR